MSDTGNRRRVGMSFRIRLMVFTAVAIAVTVAGASAALWIVASHQLRKQVDVSLQTQATLATTTRGVGPFGAPIAYTLLDPTGTVVRDGLDLPITAAEREVATGKRDEYYTSTRVEDTDVRVFTGALTRGGAVIVATSLADTDNALRRIKFWIFLIGGIGIVLAAALAAFVAAAALAPVRRLTAAAESVAATGNLTERVDVTGRDELGRLAGRFNAMLAALEKSVGAQRRLVA
ncbi:MAG TPA: HAMP domain-containing protein, partial [Gaiellaceae bacterium]